MPNRDACSWEIVVPGLLSETPADWKPQPSLGRLERLLSRARLETMEGYGSDRWLFERLGCALPANASVPEGPLALLGDGGQPGAEFWFRATPVYLKADRDQLLVFDLEDQPLSQSDADLIASRVNEHFESEGWYLATPQPMRWYLKAPGPLDVRTVAIDQAVGNTLSGVQPEGPDSALVRRFVTEVEMLIHQLSQDPFSSSVLSSPVNGLWLQGGGLLPASEQPCVEMVHTDEPMVLGLAALAAVESATPFAEEWPDTGGLIVYTHGLDRARRRGDQAGYQDIFTRITRSLCQRADSLGRGETMRVSNGGPGSWLIDARTRKRWWRRTRRLSDMAG